MEIKNNLYSSPHIRGIRVQGYMPEERKKEVKMDPLKVDTKVILMDPKEAPAGYADGTICEISADGKEYLVETLTADKEAEARGELKMVPIKIWVPENAVRPFPV